MARSSWLPTAALATAALALAAGWPTGARADNATKVAGAAQSFATRLSRAFAAHDASAGAALFSAEAAVTLIADAREAHGRAAVAARLGEIFAAYPGARLRIGRIWAGNDAAVIELVLDARQLGLVAAAVVRFDDSGLAGGARLYLDEVTALGQREPKRLLEGMTVRPVVTRPPAGSAVSIAQESPRQRQNLALTNAIWAAMVAHDAARTLAPSADEYVYEDFSAPHSLDKAETQKLVSDFLTLVPDFTIAAKPTQIAAGDDVITEMVEHATFKGKAIVLHGLDVKRFAGGKVTREWQYANYVEVMRELLDVDLLASPPDRPAPNKK